MGINRYREVAWILKFFKEERWMQLKDVILTKTVERHIAKHKVTREEIAEKVLYKNKAN